MATTADHLNQEYILQLLKLCPNLATLCIVTREGQVSKALKSKVPAFLRLAQDTSINFQRLLGSFGVWVFDGKEWTIKYDNE